MRPAAAVALWSFISLGACGRVAFDRLVTNDGSVGSVDGAIDAAPLLPFGPPVELANISGGNEDDPTLTADGLEIVFESGRGGGTGGSDLYWSERASIAQPFAAPVELAILNTSNNDEHPGLSADGLTLYFASNRPGGEGGYDIWVSTRAQRNSTAWGTPVLVPELNDGITNEAPQPAADDLTLVLATGPNSVDENIFITTRASTLAPWSAPALVDAVDVNTAGVTDSSPMLSASNRALYFTSIRLGVTQIFRAVRPSLTEPFEAAAQLTELPSAHASDPWITQDERTIVFVSNNRLYEAKRP